MRKTLLNVLVMILALTLIVSGCTATKATDTPTQPEKTETKVDATEAPAEEVVEPTEAEPVEITFWHNYGADKETPFFAEHILPMFNEMYPNITVNVVAQGNDQYREQIVISAGTGTTPDVARLDLSDVSGLADIGALIPLDDMNGFAELKEQMFEGPMNTNLYQGKYYAMPLDTNCKVAIFNMDTLASIGLNNVPKTMEEFIDASKGAEKYTINVSSAGEWDFMPYFWLFGGVLTDESYTKASGYLDGPESVSAVNELVKLHNDGIFTIKEIDGSVDAWDGIKSGEYATFFEGPWFFAFTSDWKELNLKPAVIPTYNGKTTSVVGGESIGVFSTSENPQAAFDFISFLLSEDAQVQMGLEMGQIPVSKTAGENAQLLENEVWGVYLEQLNTAQSRIPSPQSPNIQQFLKDAFDSILSGEADVQEALTEAAALIDAELAN